MTGLLAALAVAGGLTALPPRPEEANLVRAADFSDPAAWGNTSGSACPDGAGYVIADGVLRGVDIDRCSRFPQVNQRVSGLKEGWHTIRFRARYTDPAATKGGKLRLTIVYSEDGTQRSLSLDAEDPTPGSEWRTYERRMIWLPGGDVTVRLNTWSKPTGIVEYDDAELRRLTPPAVEAFLLFPNYQGWSWEDGPAEARVRVETRPEELPGAPADLRVRLALEPIDAPCKDEERELVVVDHSKAPEQKVRIRARVVTCPPPVVVPAAAAQVVSVPLANLVAGDYRLTTTLTDANGATLATFPDYVIRRRPASHKAGLRAYVGADNVLVHRGKRTFLVGMYNAGGGFTNDPDGYGNLATVGAPGLFSGWIHYTLPQAGRDALVALRTAAERYGMAYLHTVDVWARPSRFWRPEGITRPCGGREYAFAERDAYAACRAAELEGVVDGWYVEDEAGADLVDTVFGQVRILREHHTGPSFVANNNLRERRAWRDVADIFELHSYVVRSPSGVVDPLHEVAEYTAAAVEAVHGARPVHTVIQYYDADADARFPTYEDTRYSTWAAIHRGALGLWYWCWRSAKGQGTWNSLARWQTLQEIVREVRSYEAYILDGVPVPVACDNPAVSVYARTLGEQTLVSLVNMTGAQQTATCSVGSAAVSFDPYEVRNGVVPRIAAGGDGS